MPADSGSVLVRGIVNLVVGQVSVRVITFGLNLVTARLLSPEAYGGRFQTRLPKSSTSVAAFVELCCGPLYILAKVQHQDKVVSVSEAAATIAKGGLTLTLLRHASIPVAIALSWAQIAYAATALSVYLSYCGPAYMRSGQQQQAAPTGVHGEPHGSQQPNQPLSSSSDAVSSNIVRHRANTSLQQGNADVPESPAPSIPNKPQQHPDKRLIDAASLAICWRFLIQAAVHLLQSEGSKMVLALCESSYNQGVYGLVTNLGSLVVRTIFFPVEEAAFRAFSSPTGDGEQRNQQKMQILALLVRAFGLVGLLALAFGPSYSYVLLRLVYGQKWSNTEAPTALSYYCGYITLLALNGCTEAYVNATADTRQLSKSIRWQAAFSAAQVALSFGLVWRLGAVGLILADSANMGMRIAYSWVFIRKDMQHLTVPRWWPSWPSCAACIAAAITAGVSNATFMSKHSSRQSDMASGSPSGFVQDAGMHVSIGMLCLAVVMTAMLAGEADMRKQIRLLSPSTKQHVS